MSFRDVPDGHPPVRLGQQRFAQLKPPLSYRVFLASHDGTSSSLPSLILKLLLCVTFTALSSQPCLSHHPGQTGSDLSGPSTCQAGHCVSTADHKGVGDRREGRWAWLRKTDTLGYSPLVSLLHDVICPLLG